MNNTWNDIKDEKQIKRIQKQIYNLYELKFRNKNNIPFPGTLPVSLSHQTVNDLTGSPYTFLSFSYNELYKYHIAEKIETNNIHNNNNNNINDDSEICILFRQYLNTKKLYTLNDIYFDYIPLIIQKDLYKLNNIYFDFL